MSFYVTHQMTPLHCKEERDKKKKKETNKQMTKEQGVGLGIHGWKNPKRK